MSINDDKRVISIWENTVTHRDDNHYELAIPFKDTLLNLPQNSQPERNNFLHEQYTCFMQDLFDKGYAEPVDDDGDVGSTWNLIFDYRPNNSQIP